MPNRYSAAHAPTALAGPGDARPTCDQIIKDEGLVNAWTGRNILVTGTSSGIGIATVGAFALTGATVYAAARDLSKAQTALKDFLPGGKDERKGNVVLVEMDNNSLASVRKAASEVLEKSGGKLNVLVANAGVMETPEGKTKDGFETQFGVNHLSHFLLFKLLESAMLKAAKEDGDARVVNVSSMGHKYGPLRTEDYGFEKEKYDAKLAYGSSKTANIYMANQITRLYGSQGLNGFSLHPGGINSGLQAHISDETKAMWAKIPAILNYMKSWEQGGSTSVWAATAKEVKGKGGLYLEDCDVAKPEAETEALGAKGTIGYNDWAYNPKGEERLWKDSLKMVGLE